MNSGDDLGYLQRDHSIMPTLAQKPATTPIPVQLSASEFTQFILPHLSMPKRGPKCKLGYHCVFNLLLWVLYTGMQWKCLPVPKDSHGKPAIHHTTVYKVFARWSDDGSREDAFIASVKHLADHHRVSVKAGHVMTSMTSCYLVFLPSRLGQGIHMR
jgi:transposase